MSLIFLASSSRCAKTETIELKQTGLIEKILEATGMNDCNKASVPADPKLLGKDVKCLLIQSSLGKM